MRDDELHCPACEHDWGDASHLGEWTCDCVYCSTLRTTWDDEYDRRYAENQRGMAAMYFPIEIEEDEEPIPVRPSLESQLLDLDGLHKLPPAQWLIRGVLSANSATWLIGPPGGFKSFVALDWAAHVASGRSWRGRPEVEGDVIYVCAEGAQGFTKRIDAWISKHDVKPGRLRVLPFAVQAAGDAAFRGQVGLSADWLELAELVGRRKPALIVLDTQARMTLGLEENSAKEMGIWVAAVERLKTVSGACVVVVHHTGRDGKDARGSSAIDGAQDMEWKVVRVGGAKALSADLVLEKNKDGSDQTRFSFNLDEIELPPTAYDPAPTSLVLGDDAARKGAGGLADAVAETQREAALLGNHEWIIRTLLAQDHDGNGLTNSQLRSTVDKARDGQKLPPIPEAVFNSALSKLVQNGRIWRLGRGRVSAHDPFDIPPVAFEKVEAST